MRWHYGIIWGSIWPSFGGLFPRGPDVTNKTKGLYSFPYLANVLYDVRHPDFEGMVETETFLRAFLIIPGSLFGAWLGLYIFKKAPVTWFKSVANWILIAIGASLLFDYFKTAMS